jgi:AraC-like DNA-binding protein
MTGPRTRDPSVDARLAEASDPASWTHRLGGLIAIRALLEERGISASSLLADVGLPPDSLDSAEQRIPFALMPELLAEASRRAACPHFGLLVGERWLEYDDGLLKNLVLSCATVEESLEALTMFQRLYSEGAAAYMLRHPRTVSLGFAVFQPNASGLAAAYDAAVSTQLDVVRTCLQANTWSPGEVLLPRSRPFDVTPYDRHFGCRVTFDAGQACFRFPQDVLKRPVAGADASRKRYLESEAWRLLDEQFLPRVYRSLRLLLLDGSFTGEDVARHLSMHRRTLSRRLNAMGTSFKAVLWDIQFGITRQLLSETRLPITDVARIVGFAESGSFSRAFRKWAGTTPTEWRGEHEVAAHR